MKAIVRVRSGIGMKPTASKTMEMLSLKAANNCTLINEKRFHKNMLQNVKDYATWGEVEKETLVNLLGKWARNADGTKLDAKKAPAMADELYSDAKTMKELGLRQTIRLHAPRKGYEGVKRPWSMKGALGYRGKAMDGLIKRMI